MPISQVRNSDAQLLGSADHGLAKDKNFVFEAYHSSSNTFTAETVLSLNVVRQNFTEELYDLTSNVLTLYQAGVYLFNLRTSFSMSGGVAGQAAFYLQEDPATGVFATVLASVGYAYIPASLNTTLQISVPLRVGSNYRYRLAAIRSSGTGNVSTVSQATTLSAILLYNNT